MSAPGPEISVAMATYEGGPFVGRQLESFAQQARRPDEVVVCDDGSGDDTVARVEAFAAGAPFAVRLERNPARLGETKNFEKAIAACGGRLIFLADQDDVWRPEKVETLAAALEDDPALDLVFSNGDVVDGQLEPLQYDLWQSLGFDAAERGRVREGGAVEVFTRHVVAAGTTLAFRARHRDWLLPFPDLPTCHDAWIAFLLAAAGRVAIVERPLIDYRVHGANRVGIRKLGMREQLEQARRQLERGAFDYDVRFFSAARDRLREGGPGCDAGTLALIDERIAHAARRHAMSPHLLRRLPDVLREAVAGRYGRFGYGWKSVAQDLWLR